MSFESILSLGRTHCAASVNSKKRLLELIAQTVGEDDSNVDSNELFNELLARERLGSTGIGHGVAIPHCRSSQVQKIIGVLISMQEAIEFDAIDDQAVDIAFALIVPVEANEQHLNMLAQLAGSLDNAGYRNGLRKSESDQQLFDNATRDI